MKYHFFPSFLLLAAWLSQVSYGSEEWRLPTTLKPISYRMHINITEGAMTAKEHEFLGMVIIQFLPLESTRVIKLHASNTMITLKLITVNDYDVNKTDYHIDCDCDILKILSPTVLQENKTSTIVIEYTAHVRVKEMEGLYRSTYFTPKGDKKYFVATQLQPSNARTVFPCFDEPQFKATFELYITFPTPYNILSNTNGSLHTSDKVSKTFRFEKTPVIPTYLVAFIISELTCTEDSHDDITLQVCSKPETDHQRSWAMDLGKKLLQSFNEYTEVRYNGSEFKLDQVAIPNFAPAAMESWGLVMYRENNLLYDSTQSSVMEKQSIALSVAHQLGHIWFGNLVTCQWWSDIFLNEGLANFFQYHMTNNIVPSWQLDKQYVVEVVHKALQIDSHPKSSPLQSPVYTARDAADKFNMITYRKGGSLLRMVQHVIGDLNFQNGLRHYINKYKYSTVNSNALWDSLYTAASNGKVVLPKNLVEVMNNWITKRGYPLLTVTVEGPKVYIEQERFLLTGTDVISKWYIPVSYTTSNDTHKFNNTSPIVWLTPKSDKVLTIDPKIVKWIVLNNQQAGYYRVNYDSVSWTNIKKALLEPDFGGIPEINRANIVDDLFNLQQSDRISSDTLFDILEFLKNDTSYYSWYPAANGFRNLKRNLKPKSKLYENLSKFVWKIIDNLYNDSYFVNDKNEDYVNTSREMIILSTACEFKYPKCIKSAQKLFYNYKLNGTSLPKDTCFIVFCYTLRVSQDKEDWEFLFNTYKESKFASEKEVILKALGCTMVRSLLESYLEMSVTKDSGIAPQDRISVFYAVLEGSQLGTDVTLKFFKKRYDRILNMYFSVQDRSELIIQIAEQLTTPEQVRSLEQFAKSASLPKMLRRSAKIASTLANSIVKEETEETEKTTKQATTVPSGTPKILAFRMFTVVFIVSCLLL